MRSRLALALAVGALLVALAALAGAVLPLGSDAGPLGSGRGAQESVPVGGDVTQLQVSDSFPNRGDKPVLLKGVELVDATPGLEVDDVLVAGPGTVTAQTLALGPRQRRALLLRGGYTEASGQLIAPQSWFESDQDYELLVLLRVPGPGIYSFDGFGIQYEADGDERTDVSGPEVTFCVGTTRPGHACPVHG